MSNEIERRSRFFAANIICHQLVALFIWFMLEGFTRKRSFRKSSSSIPLVNRSSWLISLGFAVALILPFAILGYPNPDVANYGLLLSRLLCMVVVTGVVSLFYWIRFIRKRNLRELHLAIIGTLTSGAGFYYSLLAGAASPV